MVKRLLITIDEELCNGCGLCVPSCAEGALQIIDGKAKVVSESFCDGIGDCLGHCPENALTLQEVETVEFDEEAAMEHVAKIKEAEAPPTSGCSPAVKIQREESTPTTQSSGSAVMSQLTHFPVKLKLVAPNHPALQNASLLVSADCTSIAYPSYHEDFLKGRTVVQVCPKFEDQAYSLERLTENFRHNDIKDITITIMTVPCCSGLIRMVQTALANANKEVPTKVSIIDIDGKIVKTM
ncbi:MAG: ATP-binding protein [Candidatus Thorarchaeota archaeon]